MQASLLNYLTGFSQLSEYSNFTLHNVKIPLQAVRRLTPTEEKNALNPSQMAGDLISPRGEKNYENSILAWRMKQIERYAHSHIKWVGSSSNGSAVVEDEVFEPEDGRSGRRAQVRSVLVLFVLLSSITVHFCLLANLCTNTFLTSYIAVECASEGNPALVPVPLPSGRIQLSAGRGAVLDA